MYIEVTRSMFHDQFHAYGRINDFSYEARDILYNIYNEAEMGVGVPIELDVIAICCDWGEYTEEEIKREYDMSIDELRDNTMVLDVPGGSYLVQAF